MSALSASVRARAGYGPAADGLRGAAVLFSMCVAITANFAFLAGYVGWVIAHQGGPFDYPIFAEATTRLFDGTLYQWDAHGYIYPYSPLFAWLFVPFATAGIYVWWALHFVCVALIPSWPWRIAILLSAGFWMDTWEGNVTAFFMLAGYWAVRGNRLGGWAFLVLSLLIPKPQFLAGMIWLIWREPAYRRPYFLVVVPVYAALVLATGYGFEWLAALPGSSHDIGGPFNFLPSRLIGPWWLLLGLPLGAWLIRTDRPGWAGIAMSLYAGPPQMLLLVMERDWAWLRVVPRPLATRSKPESKPAQGVWTRSRGRIPIHSEILSGTTKPW